MDSRTTAFIELIDEAMVLAKQRLLDESDPVMKEGVANVVRVLQKTRDNTISGNLVPSDEIATLDLLARYWTGAKLWTHLY